MCTKILYSGRFGGVRVLAVNQPWFKVVWKSFGTFILNLVRTVCRAGRMQRYDPRFVNLFEHTPQKGDVVVAGKLLEELAYL